MHLMQYVDQVCIICGSVKSYTVPPDEFRRRSVHMYYTFNPYQCRLSNHPLVVEQMSHVTSQSHYLVVYNSALCLYNKKSLLICNHHHPLSQLVTTSTTTQQQVSWIQAFPCAMQVLLQHVIVVPLITLVVMDILYAAGHPDHYLFITRSSPTHYPLIACLILSPIKSIGK